MGDLSNHFSSVEFICRCGCGTIRMNPMLVPKLEEARKRYRKSVPEGRFVVTSGCRCLKHNKDSKGSPLSQHRSNEEEDLECSAADLQVNGGVERYHMVDALIKSGFNGIGIAKGYVHGDIGVSEPGIIRPVIWTY